MSTLVVIVIGKYQEKYVCVYVCVCKKGGGVIRNGRGGLNCSTKSKLRKKIDLYSSLRGKNLLKIGSLEITYRLCFLVKCEQTH